MVLEAIIHGTKYTSEIQYRQLGLRCIITYQLAYAVTANYTRLITMRPQPNYFEVVLFDHCCYCFFVVVVIDVNVVVQVTC